jgi:hypothetical protein
VQCPCRFGCVDPLELFVAFLVAEGSEEFVVLVISIAEIPGALLECCSIPIKAVGITLQ